MFAQVPSAGFYEIVLHHYGGLGDDQKFGLAWWAGTGDPTIGDFDGDNDVDGRDLSQWESGFGPGNGADADSDGDSDGADFLTWQRNVGTGVSASPANRPVPEPGAWLLCLIGLPLLRRRC